MTTKPSKPPKQSRSSLPPNLLAAARIQRLLEPFTIETKRTILHFIHQSIEESFQAEARVQLTQLGMAATERHEQAKMDFERSGLPQRNGKALPGQSAGTEAD